MCSLLVKKGKVSGSHNYVSHVKLVLREGVDDDQQSWHIVKYSALFRKCSYVSPGKILENHVKEVPSWML